MTHFGFALRRTLSYKETNQAELARRLGVSATYVSAFARGHKRPSPGMVDRIADALNLDAGRRRTLHHAGARDAGWRL